MAVTIGFGFNVLSVAAQHTVGHLVSNASPKERLANFGWFALGHSASSTIGPFIAGVLIDLVSFRVAFAALALVACIAAWLVATRTKGLPGPHADPEAEAATDDENEIREVPQKPRALDLFATPAMRRIYWVNMIMASRVGLVHRDAAGARASARLFGVRHRHRVFVIRAGHVHRARATMPWLSQRANEWQILRVAIFVVSLVFMALPWASVAPLLMAMGLLFGCSVGMSQPNMLSLLHAASPPGRGGEAVGLALGA
jgi:predicted MFS family arabinose efflux permease